LGGTPPNPPWVGFAEGWANKPSAKQNNTFCFFFWKKKNSTRASGLRVVPLSVFLGGRPPKPPWVGFAEGWANKTFCEAEQRFLLLFLEKEETYSPRYVVLVLIDASREAGQRFLLPFLEKEVNHSPEGSVQGRY
jgi:hypothetical protein